VSPVMYELGFYIPEDDILYSHRRDNLRSLVRKFLHAVETVISFKDSCSCFKIIPGIKTII
jgi:hypothetical protein